MVNHYHRPTLLPLGSGFMYRLLCRKGTYCQKKGKGREGGDRCFEVAFIPSCRSRKRCFRYYPSRYARDIRYWYGLYSCSFTHSWCYKLVHNTCPFITVCTCSCLSLASPYPHLDCRYLLHTQTNRGGGTTIKSDRMGFHVLWSYRIALLYT